MAGTGQGETDLGTLLSTLTPRLLEQEYVFCTVAAGQPVDYQHLLPLATFCEDEGLSLVLPRARADAMDLAYGPVMRCITLGVHSSLDAVGLTAAVAGALAGQGISANVIAAYHHDHILVPAAQANDALAVLDKLC